MSVEQPFFSLTSIDLGVIANLQKDRIAKIAVEKGLNVEPHSTLKWKTRYYSPESVREILACRGFSYSKRIITVNNLKGGVGKTTICHALAYRSRMLGAKVLVVDLDKQANLTLSLTRGTPPEYSMIDYLTKGKAPQDLVVSTDLGIDLIPASLRDSECDNYLRQKTVNYRKFFSEFFKKLKNTYDVVFFDTPPDLSQIVSCAKLVSDTVLVPVNLDFYSDVGLGLTLNNTKKLLSDFSDEGVKLDVQVLINRLDPRKKASTDYYSAINSTVQSIGIGVINPNVIRVNADLDKLQKSAPKSRVEFKYVFEDIDPLILPLLGLVHDGGPLQ